MSPSRSPSLGGALVLVAGVGCATAIVEDEPDDTGTSAGTGGASATGGTTVAPSVGGTTTSVGGSTSGGGTSGTSPAGGTTGVSADGGSSNTGAGRGGRSGTAGSPAGAGRTGGGVMGAAGTFGNGAAGAGAGAVATCPSPRMPDQPGAAQGNSGSFDTSEAVCYFVEGTFNTWNCSNIAGRAVTINGMPSMCGGSLPEPIDGGYYFEFGAAMDGTTYTSFYWYTS